MNMRRGVQSISSNSAPFAYDKLEPTLSSGWVIEAYFWKKDMHIRYRVIISEP